MRLRIRLHGRDPAQRVCTVLLLALTGIIGLKLRADTVTLIPTNAAWKYNDAGVDPGTSWRAPGFDDSAWPVGPAKLGFGEADVVTVLNAFPSPTERLITAYFRRPFTLGAGGGFTNLFLRLLRDDGAVVYLNGTEVFRSNMPNGPVAYSTLAVSSVGGADEFTFFNSPLHPSLLVIGVNVVAVEVHQSSINSSDLGFALGLIGETGDAELPVITRQPISQVVTSGATGTFSVAASGTPPFSYQWQFNGNDLYRQTNAALVLSNVQLAFAGRYSVRVANAVGSALSDEATLTVIPPVPAPGSHLVVGWGENYWGQLNVPADLTNPVAVAAGQYHSMALRGDGTVALWGGGGADYESAREVPPGLGNVAAISANWGTSMALRQDGTVVPWGVGISDPPETLEGIEAISAGGFFAMALRGDGRIVAWGFNDSGQIDMPEGLADVVAIAGGSHHALALRQDGTVVGWGYNGTGQIGIPPGLSNVVAVAPGASASFALKADGTVVGWGSLAGASANPPAGLNDVVALACGAQHAVALRQDGTVVGWGDSRFAPVPAPLSNVVAIATTSHHTLALLGDGTPHITVHPWNRSVHEGAALSITVKAVGRLPLSYQWQRNGTTIPNETNATLSIASANGGNAGVYRALVRNAQGSTTSRPAVLTVEGAPTGVAQPTLVWDRRHAGAANKDDLPFAMTTDRAGNVYVTGVEMASSDLNFDFVTLKYDGSGNRQWVARYNGPGNFYDFARAVAVDDTGNVYVAGDSVGADREYDIAVIKYDANGNRLWLARYDGPTHERDLAIGVNVDHAGNVFVGGSSGWYNNEHFVMLKFSASGQGLWTNSYRIANRGFHQARAMALDGAGNTYLTGGTSGEGHTAAFVTMKFSPNGALAWAAEYSGPARGADRPNSLAVDSSGNVYVTGQSDDAEGDWAMATVKYDYAGRQQWAARYKAPRAGYHFPDAVRVDGAGNAYVSGVVSAEQSTAAGPPFDFMTLKYDPLGQLLWAARQNGSPNPPLWAADLALDLEGNTYVTGAESQSGAPSDFVTMKYSPDGNLLWLTRYDGPAHGADSQTLLALTPSGDLFVTGRSQGQAPGTETDVVTLKYVQTNIVAAPIIVLPPRGQVALRGSTAVFRVVATGDGLRYQWRLNGAPISGETNATLHVATASHADRGDYSVEAANGAGFTISPEAVLTVVPAPRRPGGLDIRFHAAMGGEVSAMVQQPDGRVLVAGTFVEGVSSRSYGVVRFNADGTRDDSFRVSLDGTWGVNALALQPDGKVILGGGFEQINGVARPGLARVNADGTLDISYSPPNPSAPNQTIVFALALQPDGRLVVAGWAYGAFHSWIARFHPDGTLENMFVNHIGNAAYGVAVQVDGKILVGGDFTGVDGADRSNLFRLNANGSIDANFSPVVPRVFAMALQPDGRILLGGDGLIRLNRDGSLDTSFAAELRAGWIRALAVQPNGQVLVGSGGVWDEDEGVARFCLERVNADGSRDTTFADDTRLAGGDFPVTALVLHRDGSIWVGGQFRIVNGFPRFGLARLYGDAPAPPSITRQPLSQSRYLGQSVEFTVAFGGGWPAEVKWLFNGAPIPGATFAILRLAGIEYSDVGAYSAVIENPYGSVTSAPAFLSVAPPAAPTPAANTQSRPAVASDGNDFMVVWQDGRDFATRGWSIHGARVSRAGEVLDRDGIAITTGSGFNQQLPAIAFGAGQYFVVWQDESTHRIYGARVASDGTVIDPAGILVLPFLPIAGPSVAFNGEDFVVAASVFLPAPENRYALVAARVGQAGVVRDPNGIVLRTTWVGDLAVASVGGSSLVVWGETDGVYGVTLRADGSVAAPGLIAEAPFGSRPNVAALGTNYLVSWMRWTRGESDAVIYDTMGTLVSAAGQPVRTEVVATNVSGANQERPMVTAGSAEFLVTWHDGITYSNIGRYCEHLSHVDGARVNRDGTVAGRFTINDGPQAQLFPVAASSGSGFLVAWQDARTAPADECEPRMYYDIFGARIDTRGDVKDANGFLVSFAPLGLAPAAAPFVRRHISQLRVELAAEPAASVSAYAVEDQPPAGWTVGGISHGGVLDPATGHVKFGPFFDHALRSLTYTVTPSAGAWGVFNVSGVASADGVNTPVIGDDRLVVSAPHPADVQPADWSMTIAEVTAYGAAWRTGGTWALPPNPIPIDYVTRAAALWRGGECYEVSGEVLSAPLWWVNCDEENRGEQAQGLSPGAITRRLPADFIPGESVVVSVTCAPPGGVAAYAIQEQPPSGWQIRSISTGGEFDAVNSRVKWGPFTDPAPRTLSYELTAPRTASGPVILNGTVSFDGTSVPITGSSVIREACRLTVSSTFAGEFRFTLTGRPEVRLIIEASSDLRDWTRVGEMTTGPTPMSFVDPTAGQFQQRFYRARQE